MEQMNSEIKMGMVKSMDGTDIGYRMLGKGPGLVLVHGAFRASQHYLRLAGYLSDAFTVYIMDRRGRNGSGPKGNNYSVQKECEDVMALLQKHQASYLFGHSYGGLVALNTALQYPVTKLAVYEPAVSVNGSLPGAWLPRFERELMQKDFISASITFIKGLRMGGVMRIVPRPLMKILFGAMAKGPDWEENTRLLLTVPEEVRQGLLLDSTIERYKEISASTLVMTGKKSPGYLIKAARELETVLPDKQSVSLEGLDHNAPDEGAPERIAPILKDFFA